MSTPGPDEWRALGADYNLLGRRIFAVDLTRGPGRPMLLIHGFPTSGWDFAPIAETLAAGRRVLIPDMLGFGYSEKPHGPYTVAEQADLVMALLRHKGLLASEIDLISHDLGDSVACEILARRRASGEGLKLNKVVMLSGGLLPELHRPVLVQKLLRTRFGPLVAKLLTVERFGKGLSEVFGPQTRPTPQQLADHFMLVSRDDGLKNYPQLIGYLSERVQHRARWVGALCSLEVPLRLIWGDADPVAVWAIAEEIQRLREGTDVVRLRGIGHFPQLEAPEEVAHGILEWCTP